jgi:hypothetical protein
MAAKKVALTACLFTAAGIDSENDKSPCTKIDAIG